MILLLGPQSLHVGLLFQRPHPTFTLSKDLGGSAMGNMATILGTLNTRPFILFSENFVVVIIVQLGLLTSSVILNLNL